AVESHIEQLAHQRAVLVDVHDLVADLELDDARRLLQQQFVQGWPTVRTAFRIARLAGLELGGLCHVNLNWPREVSTTQFEFMRLSQLATSGKLLLGRRGACGGM